MRLRRAGLGPRQQKKRLSTRFHQAHVHRVSVFSKHSVTAMGPQPFVWKTHADEKGKRTTRAQQRKVTASDSLPQMQNNGQTRAAVPERQKVDAGIELHNRQTRAKGVGVESWHE